MKKIFLLLALSTVSVFSISAQTNDKSTVNPATVQNIKVEKFESVKPGVKTPATALPEAVVEQKPQVPAAEKQTPQVKEEKTAETPEELILQVKKPSLGGLSTGNATVDGYIEEFSALYNVDPRLIYAQMSQESSFKARATSSKGASGFMQLMPATAARFGVTNVYNPKQNIKAGVKYMRWLLDKFGGDMRLALAGYNAGEGAVMKYGNKIPPYRETQKYVAKIMTHYELISNQDSTFAQNDATGNK